MTGTIKEVGHIACKLSQAGAIKGRLTGGQNIKGKLSISAAGGERYEGEYEVTPTRYEQVLNTQGKQMLHNVTVHPIPSNYGLITWDGSVLTVS